MHPIKPPSKDQIAVLEFVYEQTSKGYSINKSNIIQNFDRDAEEDGPTLDCLEGTEDKARSAKYGQVDSKVLDILKEQGYITIEPRGRSKYIEVTNSGQNILRAFGHLLN